MSDLHLELDEHRLADLTAIAERDGVTLEAVVVDALRTYVDRRQADAEVQRRFRAARERWAAIDDGLAQS